MTEYLVMPMPRTADKLITDQEEAEDFAAETAALTHEPVGVYVLVTTVYP